MGQEVCIDEDGVGGHKGGVVLEEEGGGDLRSVVLLAIYNPAGCKVPFPGHITYISRTISLPSDFFLFSISPLSWFFFSRASRWPMILLT